jgi:hypothetical protein
MSDQGSTETPKIVTSIWPAAFILCVAIGMWVWAQSYRPAAARFPSVVAGIMVVLAVFDIWGRTKLRGSALVEVIWGTGFRRREMMHNPTFRNQISATAWIASCFVGMAVIGILAASPIFCAAYIWLQGRRSLLSSILIGMSVFVFQFAVFEWLLDYELYRGLLFAKGGVAAW